jgi:2,4-dienoyl-CoA reductase-like NADH-dependent reductase (Old Yellow Enzyme family)
MRAQCHAPFFEGVPALAPSAVPSRLMKQMPRAMTPEDIETVQESFARSADRRPEERDSISSRSSPARDT